MLTGGSARPPSVAATGHVKLSQTNVRNVVENQVAWHMATWFRFHSNDFLERES
jgi:hypothetical protein